MPRSARAEQAAARARQVASPEAFRALAEALTDGAVEVVAQEGTTDRDMMTEPPFGRAAVALQHPGDVSGVVETSQGYHVIYLVDRLPERRETIDTARAELSKGLWPSVRKREFARLVDGLLEKHQIALYPQLLDEPAH